MSAYLDLTVGQRYHFPYIISNLFTLLVVTWSLDWAFKEVKIILKVFLIEIIM